jgi:hypothetical protein
MIPLITPVFLPAVRHGARKCPICGHQLDTKAAACPVCGSLLETVNCCTPGFGVAVVVGVLLLTVGSLVFLLAF